MRSRLAPVALVASFALMPTLTACGSGGGGKITMSGSPVRPTTTVDGGSAESAPPSDVPTDGTVGTIPALPDLPDDLQACTELASALSTLGIAAIGQPVSEEQQAQLDQLRDKIPADLQPDLDTLTEAYKQVGDSNGDLLEAARILDGPEFRGAIGRLSDYLQKGCPG